MNVYRYDPKSVSKYACIVDATVAYDEPETCHSVIFLINQAIEKKGLDYHLLCLMKCHMNSILINEVPTFLAPVLSETTFARQIKNPFNATHQTIIFKQSQ